METSRTPDKRFWIVVAAAFVALSIYASHTYAEHQAYKTGAYIGKAAFASADFQNRVCLSPRAQSSQPGCEVKDLNQDSVMENALASANILPTILDLAAMHTGFRDGWREARTATFANRAQ